MDLWTVLIGLAAFCVSAVLIYAIMFLSMREKSFEEVIAEQKKRQDEEREKFRSDRKIEKELIKKKYKKGKSDKSKEKVVQALDSDQKTLKDKQKEHKMVNLDLEPEIIEPSDSAVLGKTKNKGQPVRKRSILHNKDEVTPVVEKAAELLHKPIKPLDDLELKKLHDSKAHPPAGKKGKALQTEQKTEKETKVQKTKAADVHQGVPVEEKVIKSTSAPAVNSKPSVKGSNLAETLHTTELSDVEIQSLIEVLLNRQGGGSDVQASWNKKNQKVEVMKKQLEEKERTLQEEQQRVLSSMIQMKELRAALSAEQEKTSSLEKHFQIQLRQQEEEKEALKACLSTIHTTHMADTAKLKVQVEQLENQKAAEAAACLQLKQENKILQDSLSKAMAENAMRGDVSSLKQKVSIMEKELSNTAVRLNAAENVKKSTELKIRKYEEQIKNLESGKKSEEDLKQQASELKAELSKVQAENSQLSGDLKKASGALSTVESECAMWKTKLQELEKHLSSLTDMTSKLQDSERRSAKLESSLKSVEKQLADAVSAQKEATTKLQESERTSAKLESSLKSVEKQLADAVSAQKEATTKLQESERTSVKLEKSVEKQLADAVSAQKEATTKLQASEDKRQELESNLKNLEKQLAEAGHTQQDMVAQLQQLRQENGALCQELKTARDSQQAQATATNGDVHNNSNFVHTTEHERIVSEKTAELSRVQAALEDQALKNNEEVKKAVSETERMDREVLKHLFPAISLADNMEHKDWLASFEKQVTQQKEQLSSSEKSLSGKVSHLEGENSRLRADVEVFKNNIAILHTEKDRIHELQEENRMLQHQSEAYEKSFVQLHAEQERWRGVEEENQRLKSLSVMNATLQEEISRLQEQNKELQGTLQEKEESISEVESKLHNLERVVEQEEKVWKEKVKQAEESAPRGCETASREQELEDLTIQQQTQIEHYRTVLTSTEQLLRQLENGEKTWEEKLQASQDDLQKCRADCQKLHEELHGLRGSTEDLSDLGFAYRCVEKSLTGIVDEMHSKIDDLQEELQQSCEQVVTLTRSNEELTSKVIVLESQSKAIAQVDSENLRKEIAELLCQLEAERKRNKELSSTLVRLNGIIKTGQDALSHEQKLVQQLQEQLSDRAKISGSNANQEIEQGTSASSDPGTSV